MRRNNFNTYRNSLDLRPSETLILESLKDEHRESIMKVAGKDKELGRRIVGVLKKIASMSDTAMQSDIIATLISVLADRTAFSKAGQDIKQQLRRGGVAGLDMPDMSTPDLQMSGVNYREIMESRRRRRNMLQNRDLDLNENNYRPRRTPRSRYR